MDRMGAAACLGVSLEEVIEQSMRCESNCNRCSSMQSQHVFRDVCQCIALLKPSASLSGPGPGRPVCEARPQVRLPRSRDVGHGRG
jgi:hypothetical protein